MKNTPVVANVVAWMMACVAIGEAAESSAETVVPIKRKRGSGSAKKVPGKLKRLSSVALASVDTDKETSVILAADEKKFSSNEA